MQNNDQEIFRNTIVSKQKGILLFQARFEDAFDDEDREEISETLISFHLSIIKALYSSNGTIDEIKNHLYRILELLEYCEFEDEYVETLWILSLCYVLEIDPSEMKTLKERIIENKYDDFVISSILNKVFNDVAVNDFFNWKRPYQKLQGVLELKENADVLLIKEYLEKNWYTGHSDMGWYDCHKKENCQHSGYWAFETVALVKLFNLDDTLLQKLKYYPGDLLLPPPII